MTATALHDVTAAAAVLSIDSGLSAGHPLRLANVGDDPVYWIMATDTPPAGQPGFPLARGQAHEISVPKAGVSLYAWAAGKSRVALDSLYPVAEPVEPGATAVLSVGPTPAVLSDPAGTWPDGTRLILYNAGASPLQTLAAAHPGPTPDPAEAAMTVPGRGFAELAYDPAGDQVWGWCGWPGTTVLSTAAGNRWILR